MQHVVTEPAPQIAWSRQYWLILRLQYADYREYWPQLVLFSLLMPVGFQLLMRDGLPASSGSSWFVAGNVMVSLAFGSASFVLFRMGQLRLQGQVDYYATLPVSKSAFVAALFSLSQLSALPGLLISLVFAHWAFAVPLQSVLIALPVALAAAIPITVVGAAIGSLAKHFGQLNLFNNLVYAVTVFLSPVLVPVERMFFPFKIAAYLLPTGQAALALTDCLNGTFGQRFWWMIVGLGLWLVIALTLGLRRLDWRQE